jgi:hypothetical protein
MTTPTRKTVTTPDIVREGKIDGDVARILITTRNPDFMKDRIFPAGIDTKRYMDGPRAVNFAHDHREHLPVARTISLTKSADGIVAAFRWRDDAYSREVRKAYEDGVLGASVELNDVEAVRNAEGGYDIVRSVLTGFALTGNPANPQCVPLMKSLNRRLQAQQRADDDIVLELDDEPDANEIVLTLEDE